MKPALKNLLILAATLTVAPALNAGPSFDFASGVAKLLVATTISTAAWLHGEPLASIKQDLGSQENKINGVQNALYYPAFMLASYWISNSSKKSFSRACSRSSFYRRCYHTGSAAITLSLLAQLVGKRENRPGKNPFAERTVDRKFEAGVNALALHTTLMWAVELAGAAFDSLSQALATEPAAVESY